MEKNNLISRIDGMNSEEFIKWFCTMIMYNTNNTDDEKIFRKIFPDSTYNKYFLLFNYWNKHEPKSNDKFNILLAIIFDEKEYFISKCKKEIKLYISHANELDTKQLSYKEQADLMNGITADGNKIFGKITPEYLMVQYELQNNTNLIEPLNKQIGKQIDKILVYIVKYKDFSGYDSVYYFIDQKKARKFTYLKAHLEFLRKQLISNGDGFHEINNEMYLQEYIDNQSHITIVSKNWFQSKDEGFGDIYSSFDIIDNNISQNTCISELKKQKKLIMCFGMPEKYTVLNDCVNGCCHTIKWIHKHEYKFESFISYEEFDGSYIDMDNSIYIILGDKYVNSDTDIEFYDFDRYNL